MASLDLFLESARAQLKTLMTGSSLPVTAPTTISSGITSSGGGGIAAGDLLSDPPETTTSTNVITTAADNQFTDLVT